jgi:hypothetical protein
MFKSGYGYNNLMHREEVNMEQNQLFTEEIILEIKSAIKENFIQPIQVGQTSCQNELVFFFKPEIFDVDEHDKIKNSLQLAQTKFEEFDITVDGAAIVPGSVLDQYAIMNRHYGFINQLSRRASEMVDEDMREQMFECLGIANDSNHHILGGHEFLQTFETDIQTINDIWFGKGAQKLRSGFYFIEDTFSDEPIILVNGFHPSQLLHFTQEEHRIYLMLLHTNTDWETMKFDLVGDTFPERANPNSIRGLLFADPGKYGQQKVGINTNGVHLSAGPFEAAYEVVNFFGSLLNLDPAATPPLIISKAIQHGLQEYQALSLLDNPKLNESDLFTLTENLNTEQALEKALNWIEK